VTTEITQTGDQTHTDTGAQTDGGNSSTPPSQTPNTDGNATPPSPEGKDGAAPSGDGGAGKDEGDKGGAKPEGAPEQYETFTMPEGVTIDPEVNTELQALAKDLNLTQKDAQRLADLGAKQAQRFITNQTAQLEALGEEWGNAARADKTLGGEKFDENLAIAKKAIEQFGTPELRAMLDASKLGMHPEVIRFCHKIGTLISDDKFVSGNRQATDAGLPLEERAATKLYGSTQKA